VADGAPLLSNPLPGPSLALEQALAKHSSELAKNQAALALSAKPPRARARAEVLLAQSSALGSLACELSATLPGFTTPVACA